MCRFAFFLCVCCVSDAADGSGLQRWCKEGRRKRERGRERERRPTGAWTTARPTEVSNREPKVKSERHTERRERETHRHTHIFQGFATKRERERDTHTHTHTTDAHRGQRGGHSTGAWTTTRSPGRISAKLTTVRCTPDIERPIAHVGTNEPSRARVCVRVCVRARSVLNK